MNLPVRRTRDNAVVAGVCAGLARRWNVDPNLLRIAVVLACLASGLGLVVYGVAVLVLPTDGTTEPPVHRILPFTRTWPLPAVVAGLGVTGFVLFGMAGGWSGLGFLPVIVGLGIWYAASRRRRQAQAVTADPTPFERAAEAWRTRLVEHQVNSGALPASALATVGQLAASPPVHPDAATDLVPVRRRGGRLWWLALALSAIGTAVVALLQGQGMGSGALPYLAVILASLGLTLLVATWRGRPRLMGLVTVLVLISTLATWAAPSAERLQEFRVADVSSSYTSAADLPPEISGSAGDLQLDFSRLELASDQAVEISLGAGDVRITLPEGVNSEVTWEVGVGSVTVPGSPEEGGPSLSGTTTNVVDEAAPTLRLTVALRVGNLEVTK